MIPGVPAPVRDLCDQLQREIIGIWYLDRPLAVIAACLFQLLCKEGYCFRSGIQTDMLLRSGKVYDVMSLPPSRHRPGNLLCRIRQSGTDHIPYALQLAADSLVLCKDVFVYCLRWFPAIMALILILERASALWAFPHRFTPFPESQRAHCPRPGPSRPC